MASLQKSWSTARAKLVIWQTTLCLFKNGHEAIETPLTKQFESAKPLSVRVVDNFGHGYIRKHVVQPEDTEAATLAQSNYLSSILDTNLSGTSDNSSSEVVKSPSKIVVHNSKVVLTPDQKDLWARAVLKKGTVEHGTGIEVPFDKNLTLGIVLCTYCQLLADGMCRSIIRS